MNTIDQVLKERGARYGDFSDHAQVAQDLQRVMQHSGSKISGEYWGKLSVVQKQALTVIADKIARILSGDPNYDDNWIDIQGYAKLAQDRLINAANKGVSQDNGEAIQVERGRAMQDAFARECGQKRAATTASEARGTDHYPSMYDLARQHLAGWRNPIGYPDPADEGCEAPAGRIGN